VRSGRSAGSAPILQYFDLGVGVLIKHLLNRAHQNGIWQHQMARR